MTITNKRVNDFISYAKTGKIAKLEKVIGGGIDLLVEDGKAFILSARFGQIDSLKLLINNLDYTKVNEFEKRHLLRHCFLEACSSNQPHIVDLLLDDYLYELDDDGMQENAFRSSVIGNSNEMLVYLCAKHKFKITKDLLNWVQENEYKEANMKLEIILLNEKYAKNLTTNSKEVVKI